jgi:2-dehydropantoate 2-reductase
VTLAGEWSAGREALNDRGVVVHEPDGTWSARVAAAVLGDAHPPVELALVLVKSPRTAAVASHAARALSPSGRIVTLQNGLGNRETLETVVGVGRVAVGVTLLGATLLSPGEVRVVPGPVLLGEEPGREDAVRALASRLQAGGLEVGLSRDVSCLVWRKLAVNCALNPLTALAGVANGALLETAEHRRLLVEAATEVGAVAAALGIDLGQDAGALALEVARATSSNRSSMLQDLERGTLTEIDTLNGAVVAEGRRLGIPTPVNLSLWRRVRAREGRPAPEEAAPSAARPS